MGDGIVISGHDLVVFKLRGIPVGRDVGAWALKHDQRLSVWVRGLPDWVALCHMAKEFGAWA